MSATDEVLKPAFVQVTPDNHGGVVIVSSWLLIILAVLTVAITLISQFRIQQSFKWPDLFVSVSTILAIGETFCVYYACVNGLGRQRRSSLSDHEFVLYNKFLYSSEILAAASLAFAQTSVIVLVIGLEPFPRVRRACDLILGLIVLWLVVSVVALTVECRLARPWDSQPRQCLRRQSLYIGIGFVNIVIDLALIAVPYYLLWSIQLQHVKRIMISGLFGARIVVPVCMIAFLATLTPYFNSSADETTWNLVEPTIWFQAVLNLSIMTACLLRLKHALSELQTGLMAGRITEYFELSVTSARAATSRNSQSGERSENLTDCSLHDIAAAHIISTDVSGHAQYKRRQFKTPISITISHTLSAVSRRSSRTTPSTEHLKPADGLGEGSFK